MNVDYFPLGTARGGAFCNRQEELRYLTNNIMLLRPTLIMSPRRYGKTSLALRALETAGSIFAHIDFYRELDANDIAQSIIDGVGRLLGKIETKPKNLLRLASDFFSDLQVSFSMGSLGVSVELIDKKKPAEKIQVVLKKLQQLLAKTNKKVVLFIDEFQRLADIEGSHSIEAVIRHEAQLAKNIAYVFSGSNRHLIEDMFFDSNRPFYKLCDTIRLKRISAEHYERYMQKAAKKRWGGSLSEAIIARILELTECHPYYVNLLCFKIWLQDFPTLESVSAFWKQCVGENRSQIEREIDLLSLNQKKLIIGISRYGATNQATGRTFLNKIKLSSTSVVQALSTLIDKDYIYKDDLGYYRLLDPMLAFLFADIK
jgi:uncharacterized protein